MRFDILTEMAKDDPKIRAILDALSADPSAGSWTDTKTAARGPGSGAPAGTASTGSLPGGKGKRRKRATTSESDAEDYMYKVTEEDGLAQAVAYNMYDLKINSTETGHLMEYMMLECSFQGVQCYPDDFARWDHPTYGNCYTFFGDLQTNASQSGPSYGLRMSLFIEDKSYLPRVSAAAGFRVQVSPGSYYPIPEDQGFTLSPGFSTSVALTLRQLSRLPEPYDSTDCDKVDWEAPTKRRDLSGHTAYWADIRRSAGADFPYVNYTNAACFKACQAEAMMKECDCVLASFLTYYFSQNAIHCDLQAAGPCDTRNETQFRCLIMNLDETKCDEECLQPCEEQSYAIRVTGGVWPRKIYYEQMKEVWASRNPEARFNSVAEARDEMAKVEVFFQELNYESIVESASMDIWDLLSSFGGTLGLYGGISFLTVFEFVELIMRCLANRTAEDDEKERKRKENEVHSGSGKIKTIS